MAGKNTHKDACTQNVGHAVDRRGFLKSTTVAAGSVALGATASAPVAAASTTQSSIAAVSASGTASMATPAVLAGLSQMTLAVPGTIGEEAAGSEAFRLARRLEEALGDSHSVAVTMTSSGILDGLATSEFDLMLNTSFALGSIDPAFKMFAGLPGGIDLDVVQHASWLVAGGGQSLWDDLALAHGIKSVLAGWTGPGDQLLLRTASDALKGRRVSAHGLTADMVRRADATVVELRDYELEAAFTAGHIDAAQPLRAPLNAIAAFAATPGLAPHGAFVSLNMRESFWSKLDRRQQAVITSVAAEAHHVSVAEHLTRARMAQVAQSYRNTPTTQILHTLDRTRLHALAREARAEVEASSAVARRIVASHQAWRDLMLGTDTSSPPSA